MADGSVRLISKSEETQQRKDAERKAAATERRANFAAACLQRFIAARLQHDTEYRKAAEDIHTEWVEKQKQLALKAVKRKKAPKAKKNPRAALDKKLAGLAKRKGKDLTLVWKSLLSDVEEQMTKQKRFVGEDIPLALQKLCPQERSLVCAWVKAEGNLASSFPKGLAELAVILKNTVLYSAAVESYTTPNVAAAGAARTRQFLDKGLPCSLAAASGFTPKQLLACGYSKDAVARSALDIKSLHDASLTVTQVIEAGAGTWAGSLQGQHGARELIKAGFTALDLRQADVCNAYDMRNIGSSLPELIECGFTGCELREGGFGTRDLQPVEYMQQPMKRMQAQSVRMLELMPLLEGTKRCSLKQALLAASMLE